MPLFQATKARFGILGAAGLCGVLLLTSAAAFAQNQPYGGVQSSGGVPSAQSGTGGQGQQLNPQQLNNSVQAAQQYAQQLSQMLQQPQSQQGQLGQPGGPGALPFGQQQQQPQGMTAQQWQTALQNPDSPQSKANALADQSKANLSLFGKPDTTPPPNPLDATPAPPALETLQNINALPGSDNISDDLLTKKLSIDMRHDSQREAALSYGARGGLAKRAFEIGEEMKSYEPTLDKVFNFRAMLIKAPSGMLIEPPIVKESLDATVITEGGNEAAVADQILKINRQAKIVTAPRDWRQYLHMAYATEIRPPPKILWPKDRKEQANWNEWVKQGWKAGYSQGDQIFEAQLATLVADYAGMVRYRTLLAEGKISQPYALQEDRGVTGGKNEMRVGDRALRITGPSQFLTGADLWKPADR
jgi:defect-in-organelle-trafficking protein DotC